MVALTQCEAWNFTLSTLLKLANLFWK